MGFSFSDHHLNEYVGLDIIKVLITMVTGSINGSMLVTDADLQTA